MPVLPIIGLQCSQLMERNHCLNGDDKAYRVLTILFFSFLFLRPCAQCPVNLGFESGNFSNWTCLAGAIDSVTQLRTAFPVPPIPNRHTIYQKGDQTKDPYGGFPVVCPNGSNYSIRLGNDSAFSQVDGVSYYVTIPAGKDVYSIIYNYAVVLQNPNHRENEQPKFTAKVLDLATNQYLECSSFDFAASSNLPGFKLSPRIKNASIYYKPWAPVTIKLLGYAGKTVKIEFVVSDCTLGAHFGYAYLDINEDCSTPISGNKVCLGAGSTTLIAPFGFREYHWFNADFTRELGTGNTLKLDPIPAVNTAFAVQVLPFPGSGCIDTLYTSIERSPTPFHISIADSVGVCTPATVDLTSPAVSSGSTGGLSFNYFTDSTLNEYLAQPEAVDSSGRYFIRTANAEGCIDLRPVNVIIDTVPSMEIHDPPGAYYPAVVDITQPSLVSLAAGGHPVFSFWKDAAATIPVPDPKAINVAGIYYIRATTKYGCNATMPVTVAIQIPPPPNAFSPNSDGINDTWNIPALGAFPQCTVDIYERSGRLVFHSLGYSKSWDGRFNGRALPVATYYYVIKVSEKLVPLTGSITLIR
ncbi:MAG: gliding motility-associated C-terminal domain-containing protein [Chitinophagaceae bacterium]|nr:gliding motility-associated C-terminal domain-containing protein [Chitinophagaceae bacterium]